MMLANTPLFFSDQIHPSLFKIIFFTAMTSNTRTIGALFRIWSAMVYPLASSPISQPGRVLKWSKVGAQLF